MGDDHPTKPATPDACCCGPDLSSAPAPSRRALLTASAGLAAGAAALPFLSDSARAQATGANADGLLARVQGQRRILLKGGVVLTLDRGIGDFDSLLPTTDALVDAGALSQDDLERAAERLLALPYPDVNARARAAAEAHFSLDDGIARYCRLYERLAG